jgi:hypothetical protein
LEPIGDDPRLTPPDALRLGLILVSERETVDNNPDSSAPHPLPAVSTAIQSTASTIGNIAQTAAAIGTFGAAVGARRRARRRRTRVTNVYGVDTRNIVDTMRLRDAGTNRPSWLRCED